MAGEGHSGFMGRITTRRKVRRFRLGESVLTSNREDALAVEEPLEIRVNGESFTVTMRTPGDDFDLAAGFLVSEGIVTEATQIASLRYCAGVGPDGTNTFNVIDASLTAGTALPDTAIPRRVYTSSSCGICGTASIEAVAKASMFSVADDAVEVRLTVLAALPDRLRERQRVFESTGGVHAAGLFGSGGDLLCLREDVGRHNAVDKVIGWAVRENRLPLRSTVLQVSGRASFELAQKAQLAGIPVLAAVSAPSSLAVELAESAGMTLVGFSRGASVSVYSHAERIVSQ